MLDFEVAPVPAVWETDPVPLVVVTILAGITILITFFLVRKELKNEKSK